MPLFSWMKWSHDTRVKAQDEAESLKSSRVVPSCMLIRELLWHVEERERLTRELEWEHRLAHSTLNLHWCHYPRLRTLIPTSELHQLEFLCSQIPPIHAASVLSRCLVAVMLCPHISMLSTGASCYCIDTVSDSRQSREDPKGEGGRASCQRKPLCVTVTETGKVGCEHVKVKDALVQLISMFREVLATNNIRPWELASIFKQVLRDFLRQKQFDEEVDPSVQPGQLQPTEAWTSRYKMKQGFVTPTVPSCRDHPREEIPTISGYVDKVMRDSSSVTANRDWDLPYYYPVSLRPKGAYSTTL